MELTSYNNPDATVKMLMSASFLCSEIFEFEIPSEPKSDLTLAKVKELNETMRTPHGKRTVTGYLKTILPAAEFEAREAP
jgi:hypothetical protein